MGDGGRDWVDAHSALGAACEVPAQHTEEQRKTGRSGAAREGEGAWGERKLDEGEQDWRSRATTSAGANAGTTGKPPTQRAPQGRPERRRNH